MKHEEFHKQLIKQAKIDVNQYFKEGGSQASFEELIATAKTVPDMDLESFGKATNDTERRKEFEAMIPDLIPLEELEQEIYIKKVHSVWGKDGPGLRVLRKTAKQIASLCISEREKQFNPLAPMDLKAFIAAELQSQKMNDVHPNYDLLAQKVFERMDNDEDVTFFNDIDGQPHLRYKDKVYRMNSPVHNEQALYKAFMYEKTGFQALNAYEKRFYEVINSLVITRKESIKPYPWTHTDQKTGTILLNMNLENGRIVCISDTGTELIPNLQNQYGIYLTTPPKMEPTKFIENVSPSATFDILKGIQKHLRCSPSDAMLITLYVCCFILVDYSGTLPTMRLEGAAGSGKTMGAKIFSTAIFGDPQQKISTLAANYSDASKNPILFLDNIEVKNMTSALLDFFLLVVTGTQREKRRSGSDTGIVTERPKCLIFSTGIEPINGSLREFVSRTVVVEFSPDINTEAGFVERSVLNEIRKKRNELLSGIVQLTRMALSAIKQDYQARIKGALQKAKPKHTKRRCFEFFALMYLMFLFLMGKELNESTLDTIDPEFLKMLDIIDERGLKQVRESSPIAHGLAMLFQDYQNAKTIDTEGSAHRNFVSEYQQKYSIRFETLNETNPISGKELFNDLNTVFRAHAQTFPMISFPQFVQRFTNDLDVICDAGFEIEKIEKAHNQRVYIITKIDFEGEDFR